LYGSPGIVEVSMAEPAQRLRFPEREDGRSWPAQGEWTYEDYLRLPDHGRRYEVIRGVLHVSAAPSIGHQFTVMKLGGRLDAFVSGHGLGLVLPAPVDIRLPRGAGVLVQPDLVFIRKERQPQWRDGFFEGAPDLIAEVTSPRTRRRDETVKLAAYRDAGVPEYWLIDPDARTVLIFGFGSNGKSYVELQRAGAEETARSLVLTGFQVAVNEICPAL
jgi:Uma2 family endonuclease